MLTSIDKKVDGYRSFWKHENDKHLIGYSIGNYFISQRFNAAKDLLVDGMKINPDMIKVEDFRSDYIRMYDDCCSMSHDIIFTAAPFPGLPWAEAMLGCDVYATDNSFVTHHQSKTIDNLILNLDSQNKWLNKYCEFLFMLSDIDNKSLPVGQPILRGPSDILGAIIGQEELVFSFYDSPKKTLELLDQITKSLLQIISRQYEIISSFNSGYSMGFYDLWCPDKCFWFQDDLNALFSHEIYKNYILPSHVKLLKSYEYTMIHLHPASFYIIDELLLQDELSAIQINKDVGGPTVEELMAIFKKVQKKKNLILWGDFSKTEIEYIQKNLDSRGVYIIIFTEALT